MTRTFSPDTSTLRCERCDKDVVMKSNEAGKFWYLKGWTNPHGVKFTGGVCNRCFKTLHKKLEIESWRHINDYKHI
jgi:hypothetical protein